MTDVFTRRDRRAALKIERQKARTGAWGPWEHHHFPKGSVGHGWCGQIGEAYSNGLYAVLVRHVRGGATHLAIRTASQAEPPWRDLQRIKNELFGPERVAIQICPAQSRLVDDADMYHLWVMPEGWHPDCGLHEEDEAL